jgi:hypothetical protein
MGKCSKGAKCSYSHVLKDFPCKYYIATGNCDNHTRCKFAHKKLSKDEMFKFLKDNKKYIIELRTKGVKTRIEKFIDNFLANENRKERFFNNNNNTGNESPQYNSANYKFKQGFNNSINNVISNNKVHNGLNQHNNGHHFGNNNIIMNYQMLNNAVITGAIQLMNNIYFNPYNSIYAQQHQHPNQNNHLQMNLIHNVLPNIAKVNNSYVESQPQQQQQQQQEQQEVSSNNNSNSKSGAPSYESPLLSEDNNNNNTNSNNNSSNSNKDEQVIPNPKKENINHRDPRLKNAKQQQ